MGVPAGERRVRSRAIPQPPRPGERVSRRREANVTPHVIRELRNTLRVPPLTEPDVNDYPLSLSYPPPLSLVCALMQSKVLLVEEEGGQKFSLWKKKRGTLAIFLPGSLGGLNFAHIAES